MNRKKCILFIPLIAFLIFGLFFSLSQAYSASEFKQQLQLASVQLSEAGGSSPVISMDFQDANLKDILKIFSQQAGLNFIASENVKDRRVTLYLNQVSVDDALGNIMNANNLTYEQKADSSIFIVKEWGKPEIETVTMIFPLQYARVKGYELSTGGSQQREIGIKEVIEKLLTEHGRIIEDSRTNSLVVTDVPSQFLKLEQAIKELDVKLPQVMIEAEIIETTLETIDKLGIEWGTASEGELAAAFGASRSTTYPFTRPQDMGRVGPSGAQDGLYLGYVNAMNLGGTLAMLAKDTDTRILARPKILTLNNEKAEIQITAETAVSAAETEISAEGGVGTSTTTIERYKTGVTLMVTPQINKIGEITMFLEPSVITTKASSVLSDVSDPHERSAKTTVTVANGQTIIIGGLIHTEDNGILRKVPFLGDIPLLGNLFRKQDDSSSDKELIIFITPHLLEEGSSAPGLALDSQAPWEYESLSLKEEAMERILDRFEE